METFHRSFSSIQNRFEKGVFILSGKRVFLHSALLTLCLALLSPSGQVIAAEDNVRVTLPDFPVELNHHQIDNRNREYPLLVYKDITYFPMTWYDSRLLGLETQWSQQDGLIITLQKATLLLLMCLIKQIITIRKVLMPSYRR
jgi:hypothetical protein